jgi:hypothetical protein
MVATYPSLARLPEVIANGGKIPARSIDVFAARTVYASSIPGVVLDCDIRTGAKIGGGSPTDNVTALNAVLATATATNPVHLIIDGGSAIGHPGLLIPPTGHVTISGQGWDTGFFVLSGSNSHAIRNTGPTDLDSAQVWSPGVGPTANAGSNVTLSSFRIHCNRGVYPNGNANGGSDGTFTAGVVIADARGTYTSQWLLTGVFLRALDNVVLDRLWIYDAPTFHVSLYACTRVWASGCRVEAAHPEFSGNTDGFHFNGGCSRVLVDRCWFATGDDCVAFNMDEGNAQDGADLVMADCIAEGCQSVLRVYGKDFGSCRRVEMRNVKATGIRFWAITLGDDNFSGAAPLLAEGTHSLSVTDCDFGFTSGATAAVTIAASAGTIDLCRVRMHDPGAPISLVKQTTPNSTVSVLKITDCSIHRSTSGSSPAFLFDGEHAASIGEMIVSNFSYTEQVGHAGLDYTDAPVLIYLHGTSVVRLSLGGSLKGIASAIDIGVDSFVGLVDIPDLVHESNAATPTAHTIVGAGSPTLVSIGRYRGRNLAGIASGTIALTGPGVLSSGYPVADALMADNSPYLGSDHSNLPCIKLSGTAHTITLS